MRIIDRQNLRKARGASGLVIADRGLTDRIHHRQRARDSRVAGSRRNGGIARFSICICRRRLSNDRHQHEAATNEAITTDPSLRRPDSTQPIVSAKAASMRGDVSLEAMRGRCPARPPRLRCRAGRHCADRRRHRSAIEHRSSMVQAQPRRQKSRHRPQSPGDGAASPPQAPPPLTPRSYSAPNGAGRDAPFF